MTPQEALVKLKLNRGLGDPTACFCDQLHDGPDCLNCHAKDVFAEVIAAERERCAKIAEAEPELPGDPPANVEELTMRAIERVGVAAVAREIVRVTKRCIAKNIRESYLTGSTKGSA